MRVVPFWYAALTDTLTSTERSKRMKLVRGKDTGPELLVRRLIRLLGYRYRSHVRTLPGCPDFVLPRKKKVIFVHGCFWHRHPNCSLARLPKSRLSFWLPKLTENRRRDLKNVARLRRKGWSVKVIWECQLNRVQSRERVLRRFLETKHA